MLFSVKGDQVSLFVRLAFLDLLGYLYFTSPHSRHRAIPAYVRHAGVALPSLPRGIPPQMTHLRCRHTTGPATATFSRLATATCFSRFLSARPCSSRRAFQGFAPSPCRRASTSVHLHISRPGFSLRHRAARLMTSTRLISISRVLYAMPCVRT